MKQKLLLGSVFLAVNLAICGQSVNYRTLSNIPYYAESLRASDDYLAERCVQDLYYPENVEGFTTVVWFHGGGLSGGNKWIPDELKNKGFGIVAVNYRLYPKVLCPKYIEDAAAAVAWVFNHISEYGGDRNKIFVAGHSAGAYLTGMLGLDKQWLQKYDIDADRIRGLFVLSSSTITHMTIRKERGIADTQPVVDQYALLYHVRRDTPPVYLMTGDRELEMLGRYEENAYFLRMMKIVGNKQTVLLEFDGYGHDMLDPAFPLMVRYLKDFEKSGK